MGKHSAVVCAGERPEVMLVAGTLLLPLLALFAAWISAERPSPTLEEDRDRFVPVAFRAEQLYRSFLINLSFAGVSVAAASQLGMDVATVLIILNILAGNVSASILFDDTEIIRTGLRWLRVMLYVVGGAVVYSITVWFVHSADGVTPNADGLQ